MSSIATRGGISHGSGAAQGDPRPTFASVIIQILLLDIVFSLDSVITAVGMANDLAVMVTAVVIAVGRGSSRSMAV